MKPYIIGAVVGAIIGYITNYIAIKMLFRPYKEKRIFGMKVPFTPGLIPKEKSRIAKSVGETIGTHLLTSETIIGALEGDTIKKHMKSIVEDKVNTIAQEKEPLCEKLEGIFGNSYRGLKVKLEVKIYDIIIKKIRNKNVVEKISTIIYEKILLSLRDKPDMLVSLVENEAFREKIINSVEKYKNSDELKEKINDGILNEIKGLAQGDKKVKQIIPQEVFGAVDVYIYNERNNISGEIGELLRNQDVSTKIKTAINDNILSGMSPLVSMFLNVDSLYSKFLSAADGYLSQEENKVVIVKKLSQYVHKLSEKDIKDVINNIPENTKVAVSEIIGNTLKDKLIKGELVQAQLNNLLEKLKNVESYDYLICKLNEGYKEHIKIFIKENLEVIVNNDSTETIIKDGVIKGITEFLNVETKVIVTEKEHITEVIYSIIEKTYDKFIEKEAVNVISLINIPKIVEEQINSFEVDFAEKIILEIASKELGAITWLGALLGGALGVLSPLLARISS